MGNIPRAQSSCDLEDCAAECNKIPYHKAIITSLRVIEDLPNTQRPSGAWGTKNIPNERTREVPGEKEKVK